YARCRCFDRLGLLVRDTGAFAGHPRAWPQRRTRARCDSLQLWQRQHRRRCRLCNGSTAASSRKPAQTLAIVSPTCAGGLILSYSESFKDHIANPRNAGELADANAVAEETNPVCG